MFIKTNPLSLLQALIVGAVACFITGRAHEAFIAITIQEICIVLFFILIYLVSLQHLLICLHWPLLVSVHFHNSDITFVLSPKSKGCPQGKTSHFSRRGHSRAITVGKSLQKCSLDHSVCSKPTQHTHLLSAWSIQASYGIEHMLFFSLS